MISILRLWPIEGGRKMRNKEMLLIPGPTPVADEVYDALSGETRAHTDPRFVEVYRNALAMTRQLFSCDGEVFVLAGSGTLSMEIAIVNTVAPQEKILVLSHGYFGDRFIQLAEAFGIRVEAIKAEWGKHVDLEEVERKLAEGGFKAVTVTHVDTSTGVESNLEALVPIIKKSGALLILDGVCASAAIEEDMSKAYCGDESFKIDIILTGSQKAIGVPPGLAIVAFGSKAIEVRAKMGRINAYYADINMWTPVMQNPGKYYATPAVNMIYAYEAGMKSVMAEGLTKRYARHRAYGRAVRAALAVYGLKPLADKGVEAPTLTAFKHIEGTDDAAFRASLAKRGMIVAGALASYAGKAFRLGHMGSTTPEMLEKAVALIGETLNEMGIAAESQKAVAEFKRAISE